MEKYMIALDQGTTSSRCILFDHEGNICGMAQKELTQIYPQPGWVEQNPREIWSTQLSVLTEALAVTGAMPEDIEGIGITNQRETTIVWNRFTGVPVYNAIVWQCRRTAEQIDRLKEEKFDELIRERTGLIADAIPRTIRMLNILDPTALPSAISTSFFFAATIEVTSSGREVPMETIVSPISV